MKKQYYFIFFLFFLYTSIFAQSKSDHVKIPFEVMNGYIVLPMNFSNRVVFNLVLETTGEDSVLTRQGIDKFSSGIGEDIYDWLRKRFMSKEPQLTERQVEERLQLVYAGERALIRMNRIWCDRAQFENESFFDGHDSHLPGDGFVGMKMFDASGVKNMVIDYKNKTFELNAPRHNGIGVPMHRINSEFVYGYYILAELDGEEQPFILATGTSIIMVRENSYGKKIYDGESLDKIVKNAEKIRKEKNTNYEAEIKIGDSSQRYVVFKYNDESIKANEFAAVVSPYYNILGLPFFKDKCVQFDFENMMLYVW